MEINIAKIPLSRYGSYMALRSFENDNNVYICPVYQYCEKGKFKIIPMKDGKKLPFEVISFYSHLILRTGLGDVVIYIKDNYSLVIHSSDVDFRVEYAEEFLNGFVYAKNEKYYIATDSPAKLYFHFLVESGEMNSEYQWFNDSKGDTRHKCKDVKLSFTNVHGGRTAYLYTSRDDSEISLPEIDIIYDISEVENQFNKFISKYEISCNGRFKDEIKLALYVMWSTVVSPLGYYKRDTMLMSNNWMKAVWLWDNCFNALALGGKHNELSFDQLMLAFDYQRKNGKIPDLIADDAFIMTCTKPPIHGMIARKLIEEKVISDKELPEIYEKLVLQTKWWMKERDDNKNGIYQYNHGNESGWDNSTLFDDSPIKEAPDLNAYMLLQIESLAFISQKLGKTEDTKYWHNQFDFLMEKYLDFFNFGIEFGQKNGSLQSILPIVLGNYLPKELFDKLVLLLKEENNYLTQYGLASESILSPKFIKGDSYWRGAVWAPAVYLIADGLFRGGETELAKEIAFRFCKTVANNKDGIYENYDALTGKGYCDPAYTWTASAFVRFAEDFKF